MTLRSRCAFGTLRKNFTTLFRRRGARGAPRLGRGGGSVGAALLLAGIRIDGRMQAARAYRVRSNRSPPSPPACRGAGYAVPRKSVMLADRLARIEALRDRGDLPLRIAVHQQIRFRVDQHRAAHLVRPIIEMRDAPQARLDAADHDGNALEGFANALRVDDDAAVRALAALPAGRVRIVAAHPAIGGVAIHHRIHVAAGDAEEQARRAERREIRGAVPIRLGDDADLESLRLEHAADDGHAEARMIHVGIAGDDDDVALRPSRARAISARRGRQERRRRCAGGVCFRRSKIGGRRFARRD